MCRVIFFQCHGIGGPTALHSQRHLPAQEMLDSDGKTEHTAERPGPRAPSNSPAPIFQPFEPSFASWTNFYPLLAGSIRYCRNKLGGVPSLGTCSMLDGYPTCRCWCVCRFCRKLFLLQTATLRCSSGPVRFSSPTRTAGQGVGRVRCGPLPPPSSSHHKHAPTSCSKGSRGSFTTSYLETPTIPHPHAQTASRVMAALLAERDRPVKIAHRLCICAVTDISLFSFLLVTAKTKTP